MVPLPGDVVIVVSAAEAVERRPRESSPSLHGASRRSLAKRPTDRWHEGQVHAGVRSVTRSRVGSQAPGRGLTGGKRLA